MQQTLKHVLTSGWTALAALSLVVGWLTGYWTLGAGIALTSLCMLGIRGARKGPTTRANLLAPFTRWLQTPSPSAGAQSVSEDEPTLEETTQQQHGDDSLAQEMIRYGRVALLLRPQIAAGLSPEELKIAQEALDDAMAIVPDGQVAMRPRCYDALDEGTADRTERLVHVEGLFLDRCAVTNRQYYDFVAGGGYEQMSLWDEAIWPAVLTFVDRTGQPGPRFWSAGRFAKGQEDHPVVGLSWYEACAYSRWVGKRLPTDAEWVKAAAWPVAVDRDRPLQRRFPWGDSMDRRLANIWGSGHDGTVPVQSFRAGASASGALQLVGNVWEWTSTSFGAWEPAARKIETDTPLKSIRGGAFDTYFEMQVHSQFQSGAQPLDRKHNIGFRCALGFCDVVNQAADGDCHASEEKHENKQTHGSQLEEATA
jgi:formylglycine-generating enzyme required for sulfatase activity